MPKKKKEEKEGLDEKQMEFIKKKVVELGSYKEVISFYRLRDEVTRFAREEARKVYNIDELVDDEDFEEEKPKKRSKKTKEPKTVKRKRKIDVEEVLDGEE